MYHYAANIAHGAHAGAEGRFSQGAVTPRTHSSGDLLERSTSHSLPPDSMSYTHEYTEDVFNVVDSAYAQQGSRSGSMTPQTIEQVYNPSSRSMTPPRQFVESVYGASPDSPSSPTRGTVRQIKRQNQQRRSHSPTGKETSGLSVPSGEAVIPSDYPYPVHDIPSADITQAASAAVLKRTSLATSATPHDPGEFDSPRRKKAKSLPREVESAFLVLPSPEPVEPEYLSLESGYGSIPKSPALYPPLLRQPNISEPVLKDPESLTDPIVKPGTSSEDSPKKRKKKDKDRKKKEKTPPRDGDSTVSEKSIPVGAPTSDDAKPKKKKKKVKQSEQTIVTETVVLEKSTTPDPPRKDPNSKQHKVQERSDPEASTLVSTPDQYKEESSYIYHPKVIQTEIEVTERQPEQAATTQEMIPDSKVKKKKSIKNPFKKLIKSKKKEKIPKVEAEQPPTGKQTREITTITTTETFQDDHKYRDSWEREFMKEQTSQPKMTLPQSTQQVTSTMEAVIDESWEKDLPARYTPMETDIDEFFGRRTGTDDDLELAIDEVYQPVEERPLETAIDEPMEEEHITKPLETATDGKYILKEYQSTTIDEPMKDTAHTETTLDDPYQVHTETSWDSEYINQTAPGRIMSQSWDEEFLRTQPNVWAVNGIKVSDVCGNILNGYSETDIDAVEQEDVPDHAAQIRSLVTETHDYTGQVQSPPTDRKPPRSPKPVFKPLDFSSPIKDTDSVNRATSEPPGCIKTTRRYHKSESAIGVGRRKRTEHSSADELETRSRRWTRSSSRSSQPSPNRVRIKMEHKKTITTESIEDITMTVSSSSLSSSASIYTSCTSPSPRPVSVIESPSAMSSDYAFLPSDTIKHPDNGKYSKSIDLCDIPYIDAKPMAPETKSVPNINKGYEETNLDDVFESITTVTNINVPLATSEETREVYTVDTLPSDAIRDANFNKWEQGVTTVSTEVHQSPSPEKTDKKTTVTTKRERSEPRDINANPVITTKTSKTTEVIMADKPQKAKSPSPEKTYRQYTEVDIIKTSSEKTPDINENLLKTESNISYVVTHPTVTETILAPQKENEIKSIETVTSRHESKEVLLKEVISDSSEDEDGFHDATDATTKQNEISTIEESVTYIRAPDRNEDLDKSMEYYDITDEDNRATTQDSWSKEFTSEVTITKTSSTTETESIPPSMPKERTIDITMTTTRDVHDSTVSEVERSMDIELVSNLDNIVSEPAVTTIKTFHEITRETSSSNQPSLVEHHTVKVVPKMEDSTTEITTVKSDVMVRTTEGKPSKETAISWETEFISDGITVDNTKSTVEESEPKVEIVKTVSEPKIEIIRTVGSVIPEEASTQRKVTSVTTTSINTTSTETENVEEMQPTETYETKRTEVKPIITDTEHLTVTPEAPGSIKHSYVTKTIVLAEPKEGEPEEQLSGKQADWSEEFVSVAKEVEEESETTEDNDWSDGLLVKQIESKDISPLSTIEYEANWAKEFVETTLRTAVEIVQETTKTEDTTVVKTETRAEETLPGQIQHDNVTTVVTTVEATKTHMEDSQDDQTQEAEQDDSDDDLAVDDSDITDEEGDNKGSYDINVDTTEVIQEEDEEFENVQSKTETSWETKFITTETSKAIEPVIAESSTNSEVKDTEGSMITTVTTTKVLKTSVVTDVNSASPDDIPPKQDDIPEAKEEPEEKQDDSEQDMSIDSDITDEEGEEHGSYDVNVPVIEDIQEEPEDDVEGQEDTKELVEETTDPVDRKTAVTTIVKTTTTVTKHSNIQETTDIQDSVDKTPEVVEEISDSSEEEYSMDSDITDEESDRPVKGSYEINVPGYSTLEEIGEEDDTTEDIQEPTVSNRESSCTKMVVTTTIETTKETEDHDIKEPDDVQMESEEADDEDSEEEMFSEGESSTHTKTVQTKTEYEERKERTVKTSVKSDVILVKVTEDVPVIKAPTRPLEDQPKDKPKLPREKDSDEDSMYSEGESSMYTKTIVTTTEYEKRLQGSSDSEYYEEMFEQQMEELEMEIPVMTFQTELISAEDQKKTRSRPLSIVLSDNEEIPEMEVFETSEMVHYRLRRYSTIDGSLLPDSPIRTRFGSVSLSLPEDQVVDTRERLSSALREFMPRKESDSDSSGDEKLSRHFSSPRSTTYTLTKKGLKETTSKTVIRDVYDGYEHITTSSMPADDVQVTHKQHVVVMQPTDDVFGPSSERSLDVTKELRIDTDTPPLRTRPRSEPYYTSPQSSPRTSHGKSPKQKSNRARSQSETVSGRTTDIKLNEGGSLRRHKRAMSDPPLSPIEQLTGRVSDLVQESYISNVVTEIVKNAVAQSVIEDILLETTPKSNIKQILASPRGSSRATPERSPIHHAKTQETDTKGPATDTASAFVNQILDEAIDKFVAEDIQDTLAEMLQDSSDEEDHLPVVQEEDSEALALEQSSNPEQDSEVKAQKSVARQIVEDAVTKCIDEIAEETMAKELVSDILHQSVQEMNTELYQLQDLLQAPQEPAEKTPKQGQSESAGSRDLPKSTKSSGKKPMAIAFHKTEGQTHISHKARTTTTRTSTESTTQILKGDAKSKDGRAGDERASDKKTNNQKTRTEATDDEEIQLLADDEQLTSDQSMSSEEGFLMSSVHTAPETSQVTH